MKVGIVGLGLIGGSFAKAFSKLENIEVYGEDIQKEVVEKAKAERVIQGELTKKTLSECDLLILAVRPRIAIEFIEQYKQDLKNTVLDICGIKRIVEEKIVPIAKEYNFSYLGAHPMAGKEVGGYEHSTSSLYNGASMILVENETSLHQGKKFEKLFSEIGFQNIIYSNSDFHDRIIAYTSQLAHVVSNCYVQSPCHEKEYGFSADSLRDLTRVATMDVDMWTELFFDNKDYLCEEIRRLKDQLEECAQAIEKEDEVSLKNILQRGCIAKKEMDY